jgi:NDP-sugar pyrophosphorylase family protein
MKVLLICPWERSEVQLLSGAAPLATVPLLGQSLLEYWLSHLAASGHKEILILADTRPEAVHAVVGRGERWGVSVTVINESRELSPAQALLKYERELNPNALQNGIAVVDHFPGYPELPLFTNYADCYNALLAWMPQAMTPDRIGVKELRPGIWVGLHSQVAPDAQLIGPCWIGKNVYVGSQAVLGPGAIVEDGSFIEPRCEIAQSLVGPDTFVGSFAALRESFAWGSTLINWKTNSTTKVPDPFLLCSLRHRKQQSTAGWLDRLSELYARNREDLQVAWKHLLLKKEG